jgi:hypothetical protein
MVQFGDLYRPIVAIGRTARSKYEIAKRYWLVRSLPPGAQGVPRANSSSVNRRCAFPSNFMLLHAIG